MKKLFFILAIAISSIASAQYDTTIAISNAPITGLSRKAAPMSYTWNLGGQVMRLTVAILTYDPQGHIINNLSIAPYTVTIETQGICVNPSTGAEVDCSTSGCAPQYPFLRALSLKPISIMSELLQYIQIGDSNGAFN